ncbi:MAG: type II secretion system F family protein [Ignavibacteriales bacterium]
MDYWARILMDAVSRPASPLSFCVAVAVFLSLWLATRGFLQMAAGDPLAVRKRVEEIARRRSAPAPGEAADLEGLAGDAGHTPRGVRMFGAILAGRSFGWLNSALEKRDLDHGIVLALERADLSLRPAEFITGVTVVTAGSALAGMLLAGVPGAVAVGGAGAWAPFVWLRARRTRRVRQFESLLPDALTMIANSLRSGYSLLQALDAVAKEMPKPVSSEFGRVVQEAGFNIPLEDSLAALLKRVESDDLDLLVTAILVQRQVGGNLAEVLDRISTTIRERMRILGEVRTLTAQGRISGLVVSLLPVALCGALTVMNREYMITFFMHPLGKVLIGVACLMQVTGMLIVRKIVNIKV